MNAMRSWSFGDSLSAWLPTNRIVGLLKLKVRKILDTTSAHAIAHNKIIIIDRQVVITGSYNFTKAAEGKNAENLLVIRSKALAGKYIINWQEHRGHAD